MTKLKKKKVKLENKDKEPSKMAQTSFWINLKGSIGLSRFEKDRIYEIPDPTNQNQEQ